ncbi:unnamed protein product [Schistosoma curassoni]|uniref:EF-hand domain-containing protein n=1 Tax=Schistosoma curassoni TaxID=6186 RepID=A0A183L4W2_9TREM|nr:unnamed protein product [Schistosoma curassoni]
MEESIRYKLLGRHSQGHFGVAQMTPINHSRMVIGGSQQEILNRGFVLFSIHQQGVPVMLRELLLPDGSNPASLSFTVRDVTTWLSGTRPTSCSPEEKLELAFQLYDIDRNGTIEEYEMTQIIKVGSLFIFI